MGVILIRKMTRNFFDVMEKAASRLKMIGNYVLYLIFPPIGMIKCGGRSRNKPVLAQSMVWTASGNGLQEKKMPF